MAFFRESCGVDAFRGVNVTPLRVKTLWSGKRSDGAAYVSYISLLNAIGKRYPNAAIYLEHELVKVYGVLPRGLYNSSYPCVVVDSYLEATLFNKRMFRSRFNSHLQKFEFRFNVVMTSKIASKLDSWPRLLRDFVSPPVSDPSRIVVPRSMKIKSGWASVF